MTFEEGMNSMSSVPSSRRVLTALFDTREDAREAVDAVVAAGVASSDIKVVEGGSSYQASADVRPYQEEGFWQSLMNLFMPEDDRYTYAEGLRRGGYVVTVECDDANYEVVSEILDREGTVDLDARAEEWRSTGWTGPETSLSGAAIVAERVRAAVAEDLFTLPDDGKMLPVTISIGVAVTGHGNDGLEDLLKRADDALYDAKNAGRNRVVAQTARRNAA